MITKTTIHEINMGFKTHKISRIKRIKIFQIYKSKSRIFILQKDGNARAGT